MVFSGMPDICVIRALIRVAARDNVLSVTGPALEAKKGPGLTGAFELQAVFAGDGGEVTA
jgi:hypothetical protein